MNTDFTGNQSRKKSKHFHLFLILMLKKPFFSVRLNLFTNKFDKHIFKSSRLEMFFKVSDRKNFSELKRDSNTGVSCKKHPDDLNILIDFFTEHLKNF